MGQSTDAILFYGYCWDDELPTRALFLPDWDEEDEEEDEHTPDMWPEAIAIKRGVANPWEHFPEELNRYREHGLTYEEKEARVKQWMEDNREALDARRAAVRAIEDEFGCDIGTHCSSDYAMPYIYVKESQITAYRGSPKELNLGVFTNQLDVGKNWDGKLGRFISELGCAELLPQHHPRWWLVSDWTF